MIMKVTIYFKIDTELLECSIRSLIFNEKKITKASILNTIRSQVESKGMSCIHFPENWGDDLFEHEYDEGYVNKQVLKYSELIKK